ncbi:putative alpha glucosidase [Nostocoides japonicum T1-X7]|uniref:Putative alpha glucosidase n=1 Tax=Nostocoides japonicum T1-X7 TaxID=1194083 RepID=A0A077M0V3_9MICO|nr:glycoside hydrolase family 13 protein [Tetrasphaera japonica]CCH77840.1 putative alpha glucosidase [Tetrasphaera japonica T1-X7]
MSHSTVETTAARTDDASAGSWWRQAVVYQIYPRSFADANADGLGDLRGILSHVDYLAELGIDAVWLSPFYPSALADGGYDVADYRDVDPRLGTLDDFDDLVTALHTRGLRIVVDIVPNHTSDLHPWFREALAGGRGSGARDRYIFREGTGPDGSEPPTDWQSFFGGSAWERVEDGQWYLHNFAVEQPDLNWSHPQVRADFLATLRFWSDRGVDGFRIDVAHMLTKDLGDPLPTWAELQARPIDGSHPMIDRDDVHDVYAEWRSVFDSYDPPRTAVAEAWVHPSRVPLYARPESLGQSFNFDLLLAEFDAGQFRTVVTDNLELATRSGSSSTWVLSNHDVVRHPTRYGLPARTSTAQTPALEWLRSGGIEPALDRDRGLRRARAASLLVLALPGSTYLYQGEELGLHEVAEIPDEVRQDPAYVRTKGAQIGRDGCRVPLPWSAHAPAFGFGAGGAHLPQPDWYAACAVDVESADPGSTLSMYRRALALRHQLQTKEQLTWIETGRPDVLHFERANGWHVLTTFGTDPYPFPGSALLVSSSPFAGDVVPGETTVWFRRGALPSSQDG